MAACRIHVSIAVTRSGRQLSNVYIFTLQLLKIPFQPTAAWPAVKVNSCTQVVNISSEYTHDYCNMTCLLPGQWTCTEPTQDRLVTSTITVHASRPVRTHAHGIALPHVFFLFSGDVGYTILSPSALCMTFLHCLLSL